MNFLKQYEDKDEAERVSSIKKIAIRYICQGHFIFDFITFFPFEIFYLYDEEPRQYLRNFLFLKLIRMAVTCAKLLGKDYGVSRLHSLMNACWEFSTRDDTNIMNEFVSSI